MTDPKPEAAVAAALRAPSGFALAAAVGLVATAVLCLTFSAHLPYAYAFAPLLLCPPFFLGTIVGLFSLRHAVRNALVTLLLVVVAVLLIRYLHYLTTIAQLALMATPEMIAGALCGTTIRRYVHAARARRSA